ncbi:lipopolysaccharide transport periplasmic protein LptA [Dentiradicibacter hellwigii]|uniref:Lipopolysaccharide export system protein LptA n=1 Tax=Dentiradicibacter hellwigii TaxID=3149053 RepID=A0ABV4UCZ0_9RHOO
MKLPAQPIRLLTASLLVVLTCTAQAEKGDREKPINIIADRASADEINKVQIFEGNVVLTQGTIMLRTGKLVVTQDADGFQTGVATGGEKGLSYFRQKREGKDEYFEGQGERIVYHAREEKTELFSRAWVKSGADEVRGQYISYNALTEQYLATNSAGETKTAVGEKQARVRAIIQPKKKDSAPAPDSSAPLTLQPAANVNAPEQ